MSYVVLLESWRNSSDEFRLGRGGRRSPPTLRGRSATCRRQSTIAGRAGRRDDYPKTSRCRAGRPITCQQRGHVTSPRANQGLGTAARGQRDITVVPSTRSGGPSVRKAGCTEAGQVLLLLALLTLLAPGFTACVTLRDEPSQWQSEPGRASPAWPSRAGVACMFMGLADADTATRHPDTPPIERHHTSWRREHAPHPRPAPPRPLHPAPPRPPPVHDTPPGGRVRVSPGQSGPGAGQCTQSVPRQRASDCRPAGAVPCIVPRLVAPSALRSRN